MAKGHNKLSGLYIYYISLIDPRPLNALCIPKGPANFEVKKYLIMLFKVTGVSPELYGKHK